MDILSHLYTLSVSHRFRHFGYRTLLRYKSELLKGLQYVSVGDKTVFGKGLRLTAWNQYGEQTFTPCISIGNDCHFGSSVRITSINGITIGDNLLTGTNVLISDHNHGGTDKESLQIAPIDRPLCSKGMVRIGNNVWLGDNVCVLSGVTIGDGVVVASNSVVTHDIPPYCVAGGVPAKILKSE